MSARRTSGFTLCRLGVILTTTPCSPAISFYLTSRNRPPGRSRNRPPVRRVGCGRTPPTSQHTLWCAKPADPRSREPVAVLGEGRYGQPGSDQIKFIRREIPRSSIGPASDLAMVAYTLRRSDDDETFELRRWSTSELPESLDREFPLDDDPDSLIVTDGITFFALRFLDETGEWVEKWDSTQLVGSSELPLPLESGSVSPIRRLPTRRRRWTRRRSTTLARSSCRCDRSTWKRSESGGGRRRRRRDGAKRRGRGEGRTVGDCSTSRRSTSTRSGRLPLRPRAIRALVELTRTRRSHVRGPGRNAAKPDAYE